MKGYVGLVILYCACIHITATTYAFSNWVPVGTVKYKFSDNPATFKNAINACEEDGRSQLVTFSTLGQYNDFKNISNLNTSRQYWLGLRRYPGSALDAKSFYWLDGRNTRVSADLLNSTFVNLFSTRYFNQEYCLRMKWENYQWQWWDDYCSAVVHHYACMQDVPTPTTTTTLGVVIEKATGPEPPSDNENMYIIIGGSLGGAALLVILVICIVIFVVQLRRKRSDERAKHAVTNPTYENADVDDEAGAQGNRITAKGNGRVQSGNHFDSIYEDRQREVVYTDVETGTNGQMDQGATYEDVSYYNNVQVTAKPPIRTDTVGYSEVGMPSQFLAGSGVGAPNVGVTGTPSSAPEDNVAELYAEVVKPQRNPAPKEQKKEEEEEETDYYALAPAIPLKLL